MVLVSHPFFRQSIGQRVHASYIPPKNQSEVVAFDRLLALISSAWTLIAQDKFIGWAEPERQKNLQLIVNNARFLILPWIQSKGMASKILATVSRQLPGDWQKRYCYRPVLQETFVKTLCHRGTCYKAANWINAGKTARAW
jgi:Domain of unknown function (DUF4338)